MIKIRKLLALATRKNFETTNNFNKAPLNNMFHLFITVATGLPIR